MSAALHTIMVERLGCRVPIIQTAMGWIAEPSLVIGSCNAGAFGFLGAAVASPLVGFLHEATGSLAVGMLVLAAVATVTLICAFAFPDRKEELKPELWAKAPEFARAREALPQAAE